MLSISDIAENIGFNKKVGKRIIIGDVNESFYDTPINLFKEAIRLSHEENFEVRSNNPQFIEALEVLCSEENIDVFIKSGDEYVEIRFIEAYNYLGDVYDMIDYIRIAKAIDNMVSDDDLNKFIDEYNFKYGEI